MGEGSSIESRAGGALTIRNPNGVTVSGRVVEIDPPRRIVFTYVTGGVDTLVTVSLDETERGTRLRLQHDFTSAKIRDHFVQGWRYQLALFSKAVAEEGHAEIVRRVDDFLRAWGEPDGNVRRELLECCAMPEIVFRDAYSATDGREELLANLEAVQVFLPGVTLSRSGEVRLSHGTALAPWTAKRGGGEPAGAGVNVYDLSPDGRIARVAGFWDA